MTRGMSTSKTLVQHVFAALLIGAVAGIAWYGLVVALANAFEAAESMRSGFYRRSPWILLSIVGFAIGRGAYWWFERSSGLSGMVIVASLALVSAAVGVATCYTLIVLNDTIAPSIVIAKLVVSAVVLFATPCIMEWMEQ